jgi:hypothetical protein
LAYTRTRMGEEDRRAERLTENDTERMVVCATLGLEIEPTSPKARELWDAIKRDVERIKAIPGAIVDISSDMP